MLFSPNNCKNPEFKSIIIKDKITINKRNKTNINLINKSNLNLINQNAIITSNAISKDLLHCQGSLLCSINPTAIQVNSINNGSIGIDCSTNELNQNYNESTNINENLNQLNDNIFKLTNNNELNQFKNINVNDLSQNLNQNVIQYDNNFLRIDQCESTKQDNLNQLQEQVDSNVIVTPDQLMEQMKKEICMNQLIDQINNETYINNILLTPNTPEINSSIISSPEQLYYENSLYNKNLNINSPDSCSSTINENGDLKSYLQTPSEVLINEIPMLMDSPEISENNMEINNLKSILDEDKINYTGINDNLYLNNTKFNNNNNNNNKIIFENLLNNNQEIKYINEDSNIENTFGLNNKEIMEKSSTISSPTSLFDDDFTNLNNSQFTLSSGFLNPNNSINVNSLYPNIINKNEIFLNENMDLNQQNINANDIYVPLTTENMNNFNSKFSNEGFKIFSNYIQKQNNELNNERIENINQKDEDKIIKRENKDNENKLNVYIEGKPFIYVETYEEGSEGEESNNNEKKGKKKYKKKYYVCSICHHKSKRHYNVEVHMKTHEKNRPRPFKCEKCNKYFCRLHDLKRHEIVHNDKMLHCPMCNKKFGRMDSLKRHIGCKSCKKRQMENK